VSRLDRFDKHDRVLIIAPHPDDETIGCAGAIQQAKDAGAKIKVLYMTNGDCNQVAFMVYEKRVTLFKGEFVHMGQVRRTEAENAMRSLGLNKSDLVFLGYPDFGTFTIFRDYWRTNKPFKSLLTRVTNVPYRNNLSYGAPYIGESILNDLKKVLLDFKPNKVFVSHPADVNGDHKAAYLFLQVALADLYKDLRTPKIYPYPVHFAGWPLPRHYHPGLGLDPPGPLARSDIKWYKLKLSARQLNKKHKAILDYRSQTQSSAFYLLSFARSNELFGNYEEVDIIKEDSARYKNTYFGLVNLFQEARETEDEMPGEEEQGLRREHGQVSFAVVDNTLLIRMQKAREIKRNFNFQAYLFGYSHKTPFSVMPKIRIICKSGRIKMFSGRKLIEAPGVELKRDEEEAVLKVPLILLGDPEFILASLKISGQALTFDTTGFRRLNID